MNIDIFLNQILLKSIDYFFYFIQTKITRFKAKRCYLSKGIIDNYNLTINGKNIYN